MSETNAGRRSNRLARESSPYLRQHAHNPVDWHPWGPEALAEARRRDVPVFLSIGYSTCYWCHVMERESFENEGIARRLNEGFLSIKVDREERPDLDDLYMAATQMLTGRGGWPMSVFLEPQGLRPFWAGTYFPPEPGRGLPGFGQVLEGIARAWRTQRPEVLRQAEAIAGSVREHLGTIQAPAPVGIPQVSGAVSALLTTFDRVHGGFGGAPKFPQPVYLEMLLSFQPFAGDDASAGAVEAALRLTLDRMALGGIFDQVGGGFHRYSVDAHWMVPHFEKMLYDNAQLARVYARAAQRFGDALYARTARRTLEYVLREMTSAEGAFFSAQDAEVDGREGANYLWTPDQVRTALAPEDAQLAIRLYGLDGGPNFKDPHHPEEPAVNVLRLDHRPEQLAAALAVPVNDLLARADRINAALLAARSARKQARLDDKVLAGWNGQMIAAMALGGSVLEETRFIDAARRAAEFIVERMRGKGGGLLRAWRAGEGRIPAFLEDYAFVIHGLMELHRADPASADRHHALARELIGQAEKRFGDGSGGYFDTAAGQDDLFVRARSTYDGAMPCGTSVMINNLIDLHEATGEREHLAAAARALASISNAVAASPVSTANATRGLLRLLVSDEGLLREVIPGEPRPVPGERRDFTPVVVFASTDRVALGRKEPATLSLRLRIAEGYHITAAQPGDDPAAAELIGLRVGVRGGEGVAAYADYPEGESFGPGGALRVHRGDLELPVVLERTGAWHGRPVLAVTFQACTETECLAPVTVELDVAIDRQD